MSKQTKVVAELSSSDRSGIARSVAEAIGTIGKSGSVVTQVCEAARKAANGVALSQDDIDSICTDVSKSAHMQALNKRNRENTLSRWRTVLAVYSSVPEASAQLQAKLGRCSWHESMALAAFLKRGKTVSEAVKGVLDRANGKGSERAEPANATEAKKAAAMAIKRILKLAKLPRDLAGDLAKLAHTYNLNV